MEPRIHFTQRAQQNTLQSHLLVPVSINGRSPFPFCVEPSRSRTLVSARTIETMGLSVDDSSSTLTISERLAYPLLRLDSVAVGSAVLNNFEVVVWGSPAIPPEILANLDADGLYPLGNQPIICHRNRSSPRICEARFSGCFRVKLRRMLCGVVSLQSGTPV